MRYDKCSGSNYSSNPFVYVNSVTWPILVKPPSYFTNVWIITKINNYNFNEAAPSITNADPLEFHALEYKNYSFHKW